ncbi:winged helix-turn-helix transcriptional regulator [Paraburkholderia kururiensis]|uniref:winged helix-turn-helix transcriptional regulator n=1 Tax=Paraburkholderia kururiensis TaxID=984307 RepID=UPI0005A770F2|nr:response regulator transcription factor [Paraburkholderia kururiensis]
MRILLASAPHAEGAWLHKALRESTHSVQRTEDLRDGVFLASQEPYDVIVIVATEAATLAPLAETLPRFAAVGAASIIVLLGRASAGDRSRVLRAGADACFDQPWSFIEIHERMQALQRTAAACPVPAYAPGSMPRLDGLTRELVEERRRVPLTKREYLLMECLLRQTNAPVPREQLIRYAWPEREDIEPSSVNLVVSRLRRKLEAHALRARIETVSRYGYELNTGQ